VDLREYEDERTLFLEELKMMTILVLRSFYYSGLPLWVSSFASVSLVLFPCLWFQRSRDSNDGGWLLLVFFLLLFVCSSVIVSLCCPVLLPVTLCFFLFSLFSFSPSLSRLSPFRSLSFLFSPPVFSFFFFLPSVQSSSAAFIGQRRLCAGNGWLCNGLQRDDSRDTCPIIEENWHCFCKKTYLGLYC